MRPRKIQFIIPLVLVLCLVACASFLKTSYVTLNESKDLYTLAMTTVADLQNKGLINQATRSKINAYAKDFKEAHNLAVAALETYKKTSLAADKDKVITAIATAASKWAQVAALINAVKPGSVQATFTK